MPQPTEPPQNTFIVRFWWEFGTESTTHWRGRVEHLPGGEKTTFHDAIQLLEFMQRFVTTLQSQTTFQPGETVAGSHADVTRCHADAAQSSPDDASAWPSRENPREGG